MKAHSSELPTTQSSEEIAFEESLEPVSQLAMSDGIISPVDISTLTDSYIVKSKGDASSATSDRLEISVRKSWESGQSAIYLNNKEVIRFRSQSQGMQPYLRAKQLAYRLNDFLANQGNPRDIKPGLDGNTIVIRAGASVLAVVDEQSAAQNKQNSRDLAMMWASQLRQALGADGLDRNMLANRGFFGMRPTGVLLSGVASWYGPGFHGRRAANGTRFDMNALTAAHKTLPFGTVLRVKNPRTGKSCLVKVTDRGPYSGNRIIDLSKGAASAIGMLGSGVAKVSMEVMSLPKPVQKVAKKATPKTVTAIAVKKVPAKAMTVAKATAPVKKVPAKAKAKLFAAVPPKSKWKKTAKVAKVTHLAKAAKKPSQKSALKLPVPQPMVSPLIEAISTPAMAPVAAAEQPVALTSVEAPSH